MAVESDMEDRCAYVMRRAEREMKTTVDQPKNHRSTTANVRAICARVMKKVLSWHHYALDDDTRGSRWAPR